MSEHPRLIADNPDTETLVAVLIALGEQLDIERFLHALDIQRQRLEGANLPGADKVVENLKAISDVLVRLKGVRDKQGKTQH